MKNLSSILIGMFVLLSSDLFSQEKGGMLEIKGKHKWIMFHAIFWGGEYSNLALYNTPEREKGLFGKTEVLNFATSLKNSNLGIGTSLIEGHIFRDEVPDGVTYKDYVKGSPTSWVPLYLYYPLFIRLKSIQNGSFKGWMSNLYAYSYFGGSAWGVNKNRYLNTGLKLGYYISVSDGYGMTSGGPYVNVGVFQMLGDPERQKKTGYYFTIGVNLLGIATLR